MTSTGGKQSIPVFEVKVIVEELTSAYYLQKSENGGFISISACSHGLKMLIIRDAEIMDAENSSILIICKYSCFVCMRGEWVGDGKV